MTVLRRETDRGWDPFGELQALRAELGRLIGAALVGGRNGGSEVDLAETPGGWRVEARLPGVAPEEVAVELDDGELWIRARTVPEADTDQGDGDFRMRSFEYRVNLPGPIDSGRVTALMEHGLLTVMLPRRERPGRRVIPVSRGRYVPDTETPVIERPRGAAAVDPAADRELHRPNAVRSDVDQAAR